MRINCIFKSPIDKNQNPSQNVVFGYGILAPSSNDFKVARKLAKGSALKQRITLLEKFFKSENPKLTVLLDEIAGSKNADKNKFPSIKLKFYLKDKKIPQFSVKLDTDTDYSPIILSDWFDKSGIIKNNEQLASAIKIKAEQGAEISIPKPNPVILEEQPQKPASKTPISSLEDLLFVEGTYFNQLFSHIATKDEMYLLRNFLGYK